jgi:hypothetical protein
MDLTSAVGNLIALQSKIIILLLFQEEQFYKRILGFLKIFIFNIMKAYQFLENEQIFRFLFLENYSSSI